MEHEKELQLIVLGRLLYEDWLEWGGIESLFPKDLWDESYRQVFDNLRNVALVDMTFQENKTLFKISGNGKILLASLKKEKTEEKAAKVETKKVSGWTIVGAIAAVLTLIATVYLIYLTLHPPR